MKDKLGKSFSKIHLLMLIPFFTLCKINGTIFSQSIEFEKFFIKDHEIKLFSENKESLITNIVQIIIVKENIVIIDLFKRILVFNKEGTFVRILGRVGNGPGEYISPRSMDYDNESFYVYDSNQNKVIIYDDKLNYVKEIKIKSMCFGMLAKNDFLYLCFNSEHQSYFCKYSKNGELLKEFNLNEEDKLEMGDVFSFTKDNSEYIYHCGLASFIIRKFDKNYNLLNSVRINERPRISFTKERREKSNLKRFFSLSDFLFAEYSHVKAGRLEESTILIYDKNLNYKNEIVIEKNNFQYYLNMIPVDNQLVVVKDASIKRKELENPTLVFYKFKGIK